MQTSGLEQLLHQVLARLDELEEAIERSSHRSLSAEDRRRRAQLLPAARAVFGDHAWCAADLMAASLRAQNEHELQLLEVAGAYADAGQGAKSVGKFLARIANTNCAGLRLDVVGKGREGRIYVVRARDFETRETRAVTGGPGAQRPRSSP